MEVDDATSSPTEETELYLHSEECPESAMTTKEFVKKLEAQIEYLQGMLNAKNRTR